MVREHRCSMCQAVVDLTRPPPAFPFCSARCRDRDLGRWFDGSYAVAQADAAHGAQDQDEP